jgi:SAM-dependent methyltransferase
MVLERDAQRDRMARPEDPPPTAFWDTRADRFARFSRQINPDDQFLRLVLGFCQPDLTLLDVGAGAGRYALPLARRVGELIAVDPSEAMLAHLRSAAAEEGLKNITVVRARWEEAELPAADLAICAHVVYPVREIDAFLVKLASHARRAAFVYMRVGQVDDWSREAWAAVHGFPRLPHPDYRLLQEVLAELKIRARLELVAFTNAVSYQSREEAWADLAGRLGVRAGSPEDGKLQAYLSSHLVAAPDGVGFPPRAVEGAIFLWEGPAGPV